MRIRPGIYFADDPVFKGQKRELVAADYVYAIKRILDPKLRSNQLTVVDGRFVGADAVVARARETGKFDYDAPIEGLQALDRYTLRFRLAFPDYELLANLTTSGTAAVAREVIEAYGDAAGWVMANPVGTGPYRSRTGGAASGSCSRRTRASATSAIRSRRAAADRALAAKLVGRKLPLIGRVEISVIEESSPRLLAFGQNQLDYLTVPADLVPKVLDAGQPAAAAVRAGRGAAAARSAAGDELPVLQHGRPGRRRLHAGAHRAAAGDGAWRTTSTRTSASSARGRRCRRRRWCRRG